MLIILSVVSGFILLGLVIRLAFYYSDRSLNKECNRGRRNYKVRFNPANNKYYVSNDTQMGDIDVCKFLELRRIYYKSKIDADFVMQKLNENNNNR